MLETTLSHIVSGRKLRRLLESRVGVPREALNGFMRAELGLRLLEVLGLAQESAESVWVILVGQKVPSLSRQSLSDTQRQALANARYLIPVDRWGWLGLLDTYAGYPAAWRMYDVPTRLSPVRRETECSYSREDELDELLATRLPFKKSRQGMALAEREYSLGTPYGERRVCIPERYVQFAKTFTFSRLPQQVRQRGQIRVPFADLRELAAQVDDQEEALGFPIEERGNWLYRMRDIVNYHCVIDGEHLGDVNAGDLVLDGIVHVAGMVGAGKSTLARLLAIHNHHGGKRTALIVGDNDTVLSWANWLNCLLAQDGKPVAVPLLGKSTRQTNRARLVSAPDDHWAWRWLTRGCPLQSLIPPQELQEPLPFGSEPCARLFARTRSGRREYYACPLWPMCPSQQVYRDIPEASVWITTLGALKQSRLPVQLDERGLRYAELVYHYADLTVFDEIDVDQMWLDDMYAPNSRLIAKDNRGTIQRVDLATGGWMGTSHIDEEHIRWKKAELALQDISDHVCTLLERDSDLHMLAERLGYFTSSILFFRVLLDGLLKAIDILESDECEDHRQALGAFFGAFEEDSLLQPPAPDTVPQVRRLHEILDAVKRGGYTAHRHIQQLCTDWLTLALTEQGLPVPQPLDYWARILEFAISVSALGGYSHYVFHLPPPEEDVERTTGAPREFLRALPETPMGQGFGFRYVAEQTKGGDISETSRQSRRLDAFEYRAVGRVFLMDLPYLLEDMGYPGPNVLAMSGTSWMPDSTSFHFAAEPQAVLAPGKEASQALRASTFYYSPQMDPVTHLPIRISGSGVDKMMSQLGILASVLSGDPSLDKCLLAQTMREISDRHRGEQHLPQSGQLWRNRQRILLLTNSYAQTEFVAGIIERNKGPWTVYQLQQRQEGEPEDAILDYQQARSLSRSEIERFGYREAQSVLVAPLGAIGRRYNILNSLRLAAFGAVYFLTRPMVPPGDIQEAVRQMNYAAVRLYQDHSAEVWQKATLLEQGQAFRRQMSRQWRQLSHMSSPYQGAVYKHERRERAATLAGLIIQACGRLLRGGVPFLAYFVDAAWAERSAKGQVDTEAESSLVGVLQCLEEYCCTSQVGQALYGALLESLLKTEGLNWR